MQDHTRNRSISRTVILAMLDQRNARRGAAATAEAANGLTALHQGMIAALRREQAELDRRRAAVAARMRVESVRQAYASAAIAA
ncbi:MAG: hypothetical protein KDC46_11890 [Thermoleophilia bacterium]|nr:hypothetical protein [Thermoleophilia bacterium]